MASISNDPNGRRRILFVAKDDSRKTVRLGKCARRDAEQVCRHIEALVASSIHGQPVSRDTATWLAGIGDELHERLSRVDLVAPRAHMGRLNLATFIDDYLQQRADMKPGTMAVMKQARIWLLRYLGEDRRIDKVTREDADGYRAHMVKSNLAKATIAKRCRYARHFFEVARRRGIIEANPFDHIKGAAKGNVARRVFVPGDVVAKVIDVAPDPQWKLLIALARWGGLRIPSEALALTWRDVDFEGKRFIVRATKTAHHDDGGIRVVPMFPELVEHFQRVFDDAEDGATFVIDRYRDPAVNLRRQFQRYIERTGVKPWPKLWQNLRASRATELADDFPSHVCASWLGHTETVADAFYRTVTDSHFERATHAAQNAAQQQRETTRTGPKRTESLSRESIGIPVVASDCANVQVAPMGGEGFEPPKA